MTVARAEANPVRRTAWAKINLTLHVTGRRDDGYHELDSLIVFAGLGDGLEIAPGPQISLDIAGPFAPDLRAAESENLVVAAARALATRYDIEAGAQIRLDKQLPVAAGLGGGSADAAAALHGLVDLWGLDAPAAELYALAASLGADVPVCLVGRPSFVAGIGERIAPVLAQPVAWFVLANPGVPLSTAAVFAARQGGFSAPARWHEPISELRAWVARLAACRNDLEAPALGLVPEIREVLATLRDTAGCMLARMSGSGATCYGLYALEAAANAAARRIAATRPGWWVRAAPLRTATVSIGQN
jgi:4-diphosphocytidyl-2-C-methyl-D-erythritol kinase